MKYIFKTWSVWSKFKSKIAQHLMICPRFTDLRLQKTPPWSSQHRTGNAWGASLCGGSVRAGWAGGAGGVHRGAPWGPPHWAVAPYLGLTSVSPGPFLAWSDAGETCPSRFRARLDVSFLVTSRRKVCVAGGIRRLILGLITGSWSSPTSTRRVRERVTSFVFFPFSLLAICLSFPFQDLQSLTSNKL